MLTSLTAALLIIISFDTWANDASGNAMDAKKTVAAPAFSWGSPADLDTRTVEELKYLPVAAPAMEWGTPDDLNETELQALKVWTGISLNLPPFSWGTAEDLDDQTLKTLKTAAHTISYPAIVVGNTDEIDESDLN